MDDSKRTMLSSALLGLALAGAYYFVSHKLAPESATHTASPVASAQQGGNGGTTLDEVQQRARRANQHRVSVRTPEFEAVFTDRNAGLIAFRLLEPRYQNAHAGRPSTPQDLVSTEREELLPLRQTIGGVTMPADALWTAEQVDPRTARFTWQGDGFRVVRTLTAGRAKYTLDSETRIENLGTGARPVRVREHAYRYVQRSSEGGGFIFGRPSPEVTQGICETSEDELLQPRDKLMDARGMGPGVRFAGWGTNYFTMALAPHDGTAERCVVAADDRFAGGEEAVGSVFSVELWHARKQVPPGGSVVFSTLVYAGPKDLTALEAAGHQLDHAVNLGMFGFIAKGMVWLLRALQGYLGNWGIAIILLTVCVRALLYPLTASSLESMGKMRVLKPEMDRIQELYGEDQEKKGAAMMALYKQHSINPLAGCLPALAQMPIWLALYTSLSTNIELYHASFLAWRDLSAPDPYFVLPVALSALMFLQQKMTPTTMDPMQAKMMLYMMPGMMGLFMLFLPAGLCVYMLTNSTLGIVQQRYVQWRLDRFQVGATTTPAVAEVVDTATDAQTGKKGKPRGRA